MHRFLVGLIVLGGLSECVFGQADLQTYAPSKAAFERYEAANQEARRALIKELEAAIKKAKSRQKLEEVKSIEALKDRVEDGDLAVDQNTELRESLNGTEWVFDDTKAKFSFTKYEIVLGVNRKQYRTLGPRAIQYGEDILYFDQELKRAFEITKTFSSRTGARVK